MLPKYLVIQEMIIIEYLWHPKFLIHPINPPNINENPFVMGSQRLRRNQKTCFMNAMKNKQTTGVLYSCCFLDIFNKHYIES